MRRPLTIALLAALLCACVSVSGVNINTKTRYYADVRVLDLLADVPSEDTVVAVKDDLGTAFDAVPAPGVSTFQEAAIGATTAFLSANEESFATSAVQTTTTGQRFTLVETGFTATGQTPAASLQWVEETTPMVPSSQALVRFVLGAPSAAGVEVAAGTVTLTPSASLGVMTAWTPVDPSTQTLTLTSSAATTSFSLPALAVGSIHTYAVAVAESGLELLDITEVAGGDGTASAPILPAST
jgi:hypothetical protein